MSEQATTEEAPAVSMDKISTIALNRMWESLEVKEQDEAFAAFWHGFAKITRVLRPSAKKRT